MHAGTVYSYTHMRRKLDDKCVAWKADVSYVCMRMCSMCVCAYVGFICVYAHM